MLCGQKHGKSHYLIQLKRLPGILHQFLNCSVRKPAIKGWELVDDTDGEGDGCLSAGLLSFCFGLLCCFSLSLDCCLCVFSGLLFGFYYPFVSGKYLIKKKVYVSVKSL